MEMIDNLETPSIIVDMHKVRSNLKRMADDVLQNGCTLRPHVKTHKIPELARLAIAYGACGITVAKVSEAEVMADGGIGDIFIAYPLVGDFRIRRAGELSRRVRLILAVDSLVGGTGTFRLCIAGKNRIRNQAGSGHGLEANRRSHGTGSRIGTFHRAHAGA